MTTLREKAKLLMTEAGCVPVEIDLPADVQVSIEEGKHPHFWTGATYLLFVWPGGRLEIWTAHSLGFGKIPNASQIAETRRVRFEPEISISRPNDNDPLDDQVLVTCDMKMDIGAAIDVRAQPNPPHQLNVSQHEQFLAFWNYLGVPGRRRATFRAVPAAPIRVVEEVEYALEEAFDKGHEGEWAVEYVLPEDAPIMRYQLRDRLRRIVEDESIWD